MSSDFGLLKSDRKFLDWKLYRHSQDPDGTRLVLVFFSDRILNHKAEEIEMKVHVQNTSQTLPFVLEAQNNFVRFSASQKVSLFMLIFNEEFDLATLTEAAVIKSHFMLHTNPKKFILQSWNKHKGNLVRSMLFGDFTKYSEPINLIADYYGEKQALYFAFLIHHIGQLVIPSIFGLALWFYQIYNTY